MYACAPSVAHIVISKYIYTIPGVIQRTRQAIAASPEDVCVENTRVVAPVIVSSSASHTANDRQSTKERCKHMTRTFQSIEQCPILDLYAQPSHHSVHPHKTRCKYILFVRHNKCSRIKTMGSELFIQPTRSICHALTRLGQTQQHSGQGRRQCRTCGGIRHLHFVALELGKHEQGHLHIPIIQREPPGTLISKPWKEEMQVPCTSRM